MICPQCGEPQLPASRRCPVCGHRVYAPGAIAYGRGGVGGRVLLIWVVMLAIGGFALLSLPGALAPPIHRLGARLEGIVSPNSSSSTAQNPVARTAADGASGAKAAAQPTATTVSLPPGPHITVTQQQLNEAIAQRAADIKPADHATVKIVQGGLNVDFGAYGMSGHYHGKITVVDGVPIITGGKIDGPLGLFVSPTELESALNSEIGAAVAQQHVVVERVIAVPGELVFYTRP